MRSGIVNACNIDMFLIISLDLLVEPKVSIHKEIYSWFVKGAWIERVKHDLICPAKTGFPMPPFKQRKNNSILHIDKYSIDSLLLKSLSNHLIPGQTRVSNSARKHAKDIKGIQILITFAQKCSDFTSKLTCPSNVANPKIIFFNLLSRDNLSLIVCRCCLGCCAIQTLVEIFLTSV